MKKKHDCAVIKGNKCPHCGEIFPSVIAVHQHILDDHQQIVAEEREMQVCSSGFRCKRTIVYCRHIIVIIFTGNGSFGKGARKG
jgi:hypothetical protein